MEIRSWLRWTALHAGPRAFLAVQALRGDPLAQIVLGKAIDDPGPLTEDIRRRGPLVRTPFTWVSADHEVCRSILRDNRFGVTTPDSMDLPRPMRRLIHATDLKVASPVEPPSMLMVDPPEHSKFRRPVAQAFTPRAIGRLRERVEVVTDELLEGLESSPRAELIDDFASLLPLAIIGEILGLPDDMQSEALEWGNSGTALLDIGIGWKAFRRANIGLRDADRFLGEHIDRLRTDPGDDILSQLVVGGELSDHELKATATLLVGAGFETTVNLIGNGVALLLEHPDQLELLRTDPDKWAGAVEEILRFDSSVQQTARTALCNVEIAGHKVAAGEMVALLLGGANHDPTVFDKPADFDVTRHNAREHLSFSSGVHACLGASLARMEGAIGLRALFDRFPDLRLDGIPTRRPLVTLRGFERLPVNLGVGSVRVWDA